MRNTAQYQWLKWGRCLLAAASFLLAGSLSHAQQAPANDIGRPFIRNIPKTEYGLHQQNWRFVQDSRGVLYVGNTDGLLEYDGESWRKVFSGTGLTVRGLTNGADGRVICGKGGDFGFLMPDSTGQMQFVGLRDELPDQLQNIQNIWDVESVGDSIFLNTGYNVIMYYPGSAPKFWPASQPDAFHKAFMAHDIFFVREIGVGLKYLIDGELKLVPGGEIFGPGPNRVDGVIPFDNKRVLIISRQLGLFVLGPNSLTPLEGPAADYIRTYRANTAATLSRALGWYAIGTLEGGLLVMDANANIVTTINRASGLADDVINDVYLDRQGSVWLAMSRGVAHVELPSPITQFSAESGLLGTVTDAMRYQGRMYAATEQGLYVLEPATATGQPAHFELIEGTNGQVWDLEIAGGDLLAATSNLGVLLVDGKQAYSLTEPGSVNYFYLRASASRDDKVYVGRSDGMSLLTKRRNNWQESKGIVLNTDGAVRWICGATDELLYISDTYYGVRRVEFSPAPLVELLDTTRGLPTLAGNYMFVVDGEEVLVNALGCYTYDDEALRFVPDDRFGEAYTNGSYRLRYLHQAPDGNVWKLGSKAYVPTLNGPGPSELLLSVKNQQGAYRDRESIARRLEGQGLYVLYTDDRGVSWFGGENGLFRYDPNVRKDYQTNYRTLLREVSSNDTLSQARFDDLQPDKAAGYWVEISYTANDLRFSWAAPSFDAADQLEYQYLLEGYGSEEWSSWSANTGERFTNLLEGDYTLRVRARNVYDVVGQEVAYGFSVLPPWYRTWYAYAGYGLLAIGLVFGIVRWREYRLQIEKRRLERIVEERTAEVVAQKEQLEVAHGEITAKNAELENAYEELSAQNDTLEEANLEIARQNKEITDSIVYAKRIQEAFLPSRLEMQKWLPESFVLFKPRDIVSGDFYWFAQIDGKLLLAGADCTGHGVPGAFMSMLGNSLLHQIVQEHRLTHPGFILDELDMGIKKTLKQLRPDSKTHDGMEICLFSIDLEEQMVAFAQAGRPIMHFRDGKRTYIKGSKIPIGGSQYEQGDGFEAQGFSFAPGDVVYTWSDGYPDQFGGKDLRKYMSGRLKDLLEEIHTKPFDEQRDILDKNFEEWRGEEEQVDDVLVIGFKL